MPKGADIAVYSPNADLQLVAEVKSKAGATPEWAAQMRRNLLAHSLIPPARFFLLAFPDHFYLWRNGVGSAETKLPDYTVDAEPIVAPYITNTGLRPDRISDSSLQLILTSWLSLLVNSDLTEETAPLQDKWLFDSGLYDAIKHGSIVTEASS
jgi:hypothetical protein